MKAFSQIQPIRNGKILKKQERNFHLLFLLFLASLSQIVQAQTGSFLQNQIAPVDLTVSTETDLGWTFQSRTKPSAGDCIIWEIPNPYVADKDEASPYMSFNETGDTPCTFTTGHNATCTRTSNQGFKITFEKSAWYANVDQRKIQGQTTAQPFKNPYSTRRIQTFMIYFYEGCDVTKKPTAQGRTQRVTDLLSGKLDSPKLSSDSIVIGANNATLNLKFTTTSPMPRKGVISLKVPYWYQASSTRQGVSSDTFLGSVLSHESQVTLVSGGPSNFTMVNSFDQHSRTVSIEYSTVDDWWMDTMEFSYSLFKNPINQDQLTGFQLVTSDSQSFVIDKSSEELSLSTLATQTQSFEYTELYPQGDVAGKNIGAVGMPNIIQITLGNSFPLQPYCVFQFKFPELFRLNAINKLYGEGIFTPETGDDQIDLKFFSYNMTSNELVVTGCLNPDGYNAQPFGTLYISTMQMPEFIIDQSPIEINVFTDRYLTTLIVADKNAQGLLASQMVPGLVVLDKFIPSVTGAFAEKVDYTISFQAESEVRKEDQILIHFPPTLIFSYMCYVQLFPGTCEVDEKTNIVKITELGKDVIPSMSLITMQIQWATNPEGSQEAGPWGISVQKKDPYGVYRTVDSQMQDTSFYARAGYIKVDLEIDNYMTFSVLTTYYFRIQCEHAIPENGLLVIYLADTMEITESVRIGGLTLKDRNATMLVFDMGAGYSPDAEISFSVSGVRNPRSFAPRNNMLIQTTSSTGFIIDENTNKNPLMDKMTQFKQFEIRPTNTTNGLISFYEVSFDSDVYLKDGDRVYVNFPPEIQVLHNVNCAPGTVGVNQCTCTKVGETNAMCSMDSLFNKTGQFSFYIYGIKNPPSFKPSSPYESIYMTDASNYKIQQYVGATSQRVRMTEPYIIQHYKQSQQTEEYGDETNIYIQFYPYNPIPDGGYMEIDLPPNIKFFTETYCEITSTKLYTADSGICDFDLERRKIIIKGAFSAQVGDYVGQTTLFISKVINPINNKNLVPFIGETFTNDRKTYEIDALIFYNDLICDYPCRYCGLSKDFCTECWPGDKNIFLQHIDDKSTCQESCSPGYTTNGDPGMQCVQCSGACLTCEDNGQVGDYKRCTKCREGYGLLDFDTGECLSECPYGMFDQGDGTCGECDLNCGTCEGIPTNCTSCDSDSDFPYLDVAACYPDCPYGYGNKGGVCAPCVPPCETCADNVLICDSCDGSEGRSLLFGPNCYETCPNGTIRDGDKEQCTGCTAGCVDCNKEHQTCETCKSGLLLWKGGCLSVCPKEATANWEQTACISLSELNVHYLYFPLTLMTLLLLFASFVGHYVKPRHQVLANFVIMCSGLEHIAIIAQFFYALVYENVLWFFFSLSIWLSYLVAQFFFYRSFKVQIIENDLNFRRWLNQKSNIHTARTLNFLGTFLSWRFYKLLYSHFYGYQFKTLDLSNVKSYQALMHKFTFWMDFAVYLPIVIMNPIILGFTEWGNQFTMCVLENIMLVIMMAIVTYYEKGMMVVNQDKDKIRRDKKREQMRLMSAMDDTVDITTNKSFGLQTYKETFKQLTAEQLVKEFGKRGSLTMPIQGVKNKEKDPRQGIHSYPLSPKTVIKAANPPIALGPQQPDNVYHSPKDKNRLNELKPLDGHGRNKAIQCGGPYESDLLRMDASVVHTSMITPVFSNKLERKESKNVRRGRKNRFFHQIDKEDNHAGAIIDSDEDGETANRKARADHLKRIKEEGERMYVKGDLSLFEKAQRIKEPEGVRDMLEDKDKQDRMKKLMDQLRDEDTQRAQSFKAKISQEEEKLKGKSRRLSTGAGSSDFSRIDSAQSKDNRQTHIEVGRKVAPAPLPDLPQYDMSKLWFNECMVAGDFQRDKVSGQAILKPTRQTGVFMDNKQRRVTKEGYLLDPSGNIIHNTTNKVVFKEASIRNDELPAPFCTEKFNFNAFELMGTFTSFYDTRDSQTFAHTTSKDGKIKYDSQKRPVNFQGFLLDKAGNLISANKNSASQILFPSSLLSQDGGMPSLYTLEDKPFTIHEVLGAFSNIKDGKVPLHKKQPLTQDESGRPVNECGYLVNKYGDIISRNGKVLFQRKYLRNGEFPKYFNFSRVDVARIRGDLTFDPKTDAPLDLQPSLQSGSYADKQGRKVNQRGFLLDKNQNVIDQLGYVMFPRDFMQSNGDVPELFRRQIANDKIKHK